MACLRLQKMYIFGIDLFCQINGAFYSHYRDLIVEPQLNATNDCIFSSSSLRTEVARIFSILKESLNWMHQQVFLWLFYHLSRPWHL